MLKKEVMINIKIIEQLKIKFESMSHENNMMKENMISPAKYEDLEDIYNNLKDKNDNLKKDNEILRKKGNDSLEDEEKKLKEEHEKFEEQISKEIKQKSKEIKQKVNEIKVENNNQTSDELLDDLMKSMEGFANEFDDLSKELDKTQ